MASGWSRQGLYILMHACSSGTGVLVDPRVLKTEVEMLGVKGRIFVDSRCGIIEEDHIKRDKASDHLAKKIGSTGSGCGPANADRIMRTARLARDVPELKEYLIDVPLELNNAISRGETGTCSKEPRALGFPCTTGHTRS